MMDWPNAFSGINKTFLGRLTSIEVDQSSFLKRCERWVRSILNFGQPLTPRNRHIATKANVDVFARVTLPRIVGSAVDPLPRIVGSAVDQTSVLV